MTGVVLCEPDPEPPHTRVRLQLSAAGRPRGAAARARDRRPAPLRHRRAAARLARRWRRSSPRASASSPSTSASPPRTCAGSRAGAATPIKALLLDQRRIAGVGNIYADEALFRARIHPLRPPGRLSPRAARRSARGRDRGAQAGIDARGASIDDFRHLDGVRGSFQDRSSSTAARASPAAVRRHDRQDGRRRARHLRVRDLPAATAAAPRARPRAGAAQAWRRAARPGGRCRRRPGARRSRPSSAVADEHLGEAHHPRALHELGAPGGVLGQVDLRELHAARGSAAPSRGRRRSTVGRIHGYPTHYFIKYSQGWPPRAAASPPQATVALVGARTARREAARP